jgi:hypothetical protein
VSGRNAPEGKLVFASSASFFDEQGGDVMFKHTQTEASQRERDGLVPSTLLQQGDVPQMQLSSFSTIDTTSSLSRGTDR